MYIAGKPFSLLSLGVCENDRDDPSQLVDPSAADPSRVAEHRDSRSFIVRGLSRRDRAIVVLMYFEGMTMLETGRAIGRSESRVSQLHKELLQRLRSRLGTYLCCERVHEAFERVRDGRQAADSADRPAHPVVELPESIAVDDQVIRAIDSLRASRSQNKLLTHLPHRSITTFPPAYGGFYGDCLVVVYGPRL